MNNQSRERETPMAEPLTDLEERLLKIAWDKSTLLMEYPREEVEAAEEKILNKLRVVLYLKSKKQEEVKNLE